VKIANFTFTANFTSILYAALGVFGLFTNAVLGVALLLAAAVASSDHRHRNVIAAVLIFLGLLFSAPLISAIAFGLAAYVASTGVRFALSYCLWIFAASSLLTGNLVAAVVLAVAGGFFVWFQKRKEQ
jgi:hypothetical protein